ncbi:MAG: putative hydro-lyase [Planctomycetia bacterium]|nr:putative hydro-lyase [Planctomycetia bacterium]
MQPLSPHSTAEEVRLASRSGQWTKPTSGLAMGFVQANLVVLPKEYAFDFLLFCLRNPQACPLLSVVEAGQVEPIDIAPGADLRTDLPRYAVYQDGVLFDQPTDIQAFWRNDLVSFLLGCSFSFESVMIEENLPLRHLEQNVNVPMYRTNQKNRAAGIFEGELVVSMRPLKPELINLASHLSGRMPLAHGAPVFAGDPAELGIRDINKPDFGDPVTIHEGEIPVFWACGVTPQAAIMAARPTLALTHCPGHMFLTDMRDHDIIHSS